MHFVVKVTVNKGESRIGSFTKETIVRYSEYSIEKVRELGDEAVREFCALHGIQLPVDKQMISADVAIREVR